MIKSREQSSKGKCLSFFGVDENASEVSKTSFIFVLFWGSSSLKNLLLVFFGVYAKIFVRQITSIFIY